MKEKIDTYPKHNIADDNPYQKLMGINSALLAASKTLQQKKSKLLTANNALNDFKAAVAERQYGSFFKIDMNAADNFDQTRVKDFHEDHLTSQEREELNLRKQTITAAEAEVKNAEELLTSLENEKQALPPLLDHAETILAQTLQFQKQLKDAYQLVDMLKSAIYQHENAIVKIKSDMASTDTLVQKRQDLLADIAIGNATQNDLEAFDKKIGKSVTEINKTAQSEIDQAQQTITGLQRKLATATDNLKSLTQQKNEVFSGFIMLDVEKTAIEYADLAEKLMAKYKQLLSLDNILTDLGGGSITGGDVYRLLIPTFDTQTHRGINSMEWTFNGVTDDELMIERARIESLGIAI